MWSFDLSSDSSLTHTAIRLLVSGGRNGELRNYLDFPHPRVSQFPGVCLESTDLALVAALALSVLPPASAEDTRANA